MTIHGGDETDRRGTRGNRVTLVFHWDVFSERTSKCKQKRMKTCYYITIGDSRRKKMVPEFYVTRKIKISSHL